VPANNEYFGFNVEKVYKFVFHFFILWEGMNFLREDRP
jgi:hypothetical protein